MIAPLFTSLERLRAAANLSVTSHDDDLLSCGVAASDMMQGYMSRGVRVEPRAEVYRVPPSGVLFLRDPVTAGIVSISVPDGNGGQRILGSGSYWLCGDNELHITETIDPKAPATVTANGGMGAGKPRYSVSASVTSGTPANGAVTGTGGVVGSIVSWSASGIAIIETTAGSIDSGAVITGSGFSFMVIESAQEVDLSKYRSLSKACEQQSVYMYQRRTSLGRTAATMGGTTAFEKDYDLLPGVERVLDILSPPILF